MELSRSDSGLLLAHERRDAGEIEPLLRRLDPALSLQGWPHPSGSILWKVVRHAGGDRPPETVLSWVNKWGEPIPLGEAIVHAIQRLDKNSSRSDYVDPDELNARFKEELDRHDDEQSQASVEDWLMKHGRPLLPRGQWLRAARARARNAGRRNHFG